MLRNFYLFLVISFFSHFLQAACDPTIPWRSVDFYRGELGEAPAQAMPTGVATWRNYAYASGGSGKRPRMWIVRRSVNRGERWGSSDRFLPSGFDASGVAAHVAVDPRNGHVYAVGTVFRGVTPYERSPYWVVRKSTNNGLSWSTVDLFRSDLRPTRVAVSNTGIVYVLGSKFSPTRNILRRSGDGGRSWINVSIRDDRFLAQALVVTSVGRVFVAGGFMNERVGWRVRSSADGLSGWVTVSEISESSEGYRGIHPTVHDGTLTGDGYVAFTGHFLRSLSPTLFSSFVTIKGPASGLSAGWRFVDRPLGLGYGWGITYSPMHGQIFITGSMEGISAGTSLITRRGNELSFVGSDRLDHDYHSMETEDEYVSSWGGASVTDLGDVLTVNRSFFRGPGHGWMIRKLSCTRD